jgi:LPS export ABC transporter protein LptC
MRGPSTIGPRTTLGARCIAVAVALVLGLFSAGCSPRGPASPSAKGAVLPDQEINDFILTESDAGNPLWKLFARYAAEYSTRDLYVARSLRVDFFDDKGENASVLTAREGEINSRNRNMIARGNVVLQTTEGTRLSTEVLQFLNREQLIVVPDDQLVRVERGNDVLTGYGFQSDPDLKQYEFKRRVEATVRSRVPLEPESR